MARESRRGSFKGKVSHNSAQQRAKATSYGHLSLPHGIQVFKEEPGTVHLDILPYVVTDERHPDRKDEVGIAVPGEYWYRRPYKLHRNIGSDQTAMVCPTSIGKKCPVCEHRAKLLNDGVDYKDDRVKALKASERVLYYVQPKGERKWEDKPHLWDISHFLFQEKLNDEVKENPDCETFPDLEEGFTLRIRFTEGKIGTTTFAETSRIDFDDRKYAYDERDIDELSSLDDVLIIRTYDELERAFLETGDDEDEADGKQDDDGKAGRARDRDRDRERDRKPAEDRETRGDRSGGDRADPKERARGSDDRETRSDRGGSTSTRTERERGSTRERPKDDPKPSEADAGETRRRREPPKEEAKADPKREARGDKSDTERCPHGHRFGKDCDQFKDCEECGVWSQCMDQMEAAA